MLYMLLSLLDCKKPPIRLGTMVGVDTPEMKAKEVGERKRAREVKRVVENIMRPSRLVQATFASLAVEVAFEPLSPTLPREDAQPRVARTRPHSGNVPRGLGP